VVPALAVADALVERGASVSFVGTRDRAEAKLVPDAGYEIDFLNVSGIDRRNPLRAALALGRAAAGVRVARRYRAYRRVELLPVSRDRAIYRHDINSRFPGAFVDPHRFREVSPGGAAHVGVGVPVARVSGGGGRGGHGRCDLDGGFCPHVLNHAVIPGVAVLVSEHDEMTGHGRSRIGRRIPKRTTRVPSLR